MATNELPEKFTQLLEFYADHITAVSLGEWRMRFEYSPDLMSPWEREHAEINRCGAALILCAVEAPDRNFRHPVELLLLYPATHAAMREQFERFDFGWDDFHSAMDKEHLREARNTPARVRARRAEAVRIFDAMGEECPLFLKGMSRWKAGFSFARTPDEERAAHWRREIRRHYERGYAGEDPAKAPDTNPATEADLLPETGKYNFFLMGSLGGYRA